jgi:MiaB/RimO family radical SAM methylthiotransferase
MRTYRLCTRRNADSQRIYDCLVANNWTFTKDIHLADLIVISTCGATDQTEDWSLDNIEDILEKKSESSEIIITGCLPNINPERIQELGSFRVISPRRLDDFDEIIDANVKIRELKEVGTTCVPDFITEKKDTLEDKFKRYIKGFNLSVDFIKFCIRTVKRRWERHTPSYDIRIARGCLSNCTYCAIKLATGRLESKPINQIIDEFKTGLKKGYKLFRFVAIDTGCYGMDIDTSIIELLEKTFSLEGNFKLVITDFNPQWLIKYYDELIPIIRKNQTRLLGISTPIQSGSDRILRLMKRPYKIEKVKEKLKDLHNKFPRLRLRTQIIVGFPGETAEDFVETKKLIQECNFYQVEFFKYNDRPNTEAVELEKKIPVEIINDRAQELLDLGGSLQN